MRTSDKKARNAINTLKLYGIFWTALIIMFTAIICMQAGNYINLSSEIAGLNQQIDDMDADQQALHQTIAFNRSDSYIEQYAHEELGLVHSYEIVFINDNYKP